MALRVIVLQDSQLLAKNGKQPCTHPYQIILSMFTQLNMKMREGSKLLHAVIPLYNLCFSHFLTVHQNLPLGINQRFL